MMLALLYVAAAAGFYAYVRRSAPVMDFGALEPNTAPARGQIIELFPTSEQKAA